MRIELSVALALLLATTARAQEETISFPAAVSFETGDSWQYEGRKFRLFGVQACIRGTIYRAPDGAESDCGMQSIASLAALFSTGSIGCQPVGRAKDDATFVVCAAQLDNATVDVGTALISSGAAFAAVFPSGAPVSAAYAVAESSARDKVSGLWSGTFAHPVSVLLDK
ncbi:thermonuclease family protein [Rhizobium daejeonense]|uniref:Thermonuclease family protein n=1 Tax=Rhizobium daejeonense TaxID=240521 RepID=A0A6M1RY32_9HYPH|nr:MULTISPECIES: thermonuclease family protein [Rhizobiaceae]NGO66512.1 thermonuclease family protein [Rhizobium daejeonense]QRI66751.1 thermonuclease family protein [Shinella sp. PSBB067]